MKKSQEEKLISRITKALYTTILKSATQVPEDIMQELIKLKNKEENEMHNQIAATQLKLMIENINFGKENTIPICQDTGLVNVFIQLGEQFPIISNFKNIISKVLSQLTNESKLRPNTVDPITQGNHKDNLGENMPPIYLDLIPNNSDLIITTLNKGGGSENISALFMMSAATGYETFVEKIIKTVDEAKGKPCPPIIIGIGLGGDAVKSMYLAKKAILRPLFSRNKRKEVSNLEEEILRKANELNIGVMGLGGHSNCLDVRMEWAMRHPASYPVGLVVQCYSHRSFSCKITSDGEVSYGKLDGEHQFTEGEN